LSGLYLDKNQLIGIIPLSISNLVELVNLHLYQNQLIGPITFRLSSFPQLQQIFLQQNRFTGHLHLLSSSSASNVSFSSPELLNLDVSDNLFSGSIPSTLFLASRLQSISLSLNCFEHELPLMICEATSAHVVSMDGLGSAKGCKNIIPLPFPFTSVDLVRSMRGSIPDCVWSMSNLRMLNLAGNGFQGSIGRVSSMSSLFSLTLSHNYLSGEIPLWLAEKKMLHLDLSHNKLTGDASGFKYQADFINISLPRQLENQTLRSIAWNQSLILSVNRLSGNLPSSFGRYQDLDILSGNLFGCRHLPKNDKNSESISCGSEQYNQSMTLLGGVLGLILCSVAMYHLLCQLSSSFKSHNGKHKVTFLRYLRYYQSTLFYSDTLSPHPLKSIVLFGSLLSHLISLACVLTALCCLLSLPVYVLKQLDVETNDGGDTQYATHTHMYNWLWTMAFVSGTTPAIILLMTSFVCLLYFNVVINRLGGNIELSLSLSSSQSSSAVPSVSLTVWILFFLNLIVVGTVNGLYIWSTLLHLMSEIRVWIQLSFALFSFLWTGVLCHRLSFQIKESRYGVWLFICLNAINHVMIPCIVTALSTPSCYQVGSLCYSSHHFDFLLFLFLCSVFYVL
jgi:hypothetical protein